MRCKGTGLFVSAASQIFLLLIVFVFPANAQTTYAKKIELPPLRMSLNQLQAILGKGVTLMKAANGTSLMVRDEMELGRRELKIKIAGNQLVTDRARIPDPFDAFEYTGATRDPAPIGRLELSFRDYSRTLSVEGESPDQVDALFAALRGELLPLSTTFGGSTFRNLISYTTYVILGSILLTLVIVWTFTRLHILLLPIVLIILIISAAILLPLDDIFAGFLVVRGEASFIVRYEAEITFASFIIAALMIPISLILILPRRASSAQAASPGQAS